MSTEIEDAVAGQVEALLAYKVFTTGSKGFHCQGQVTAGGTQYQVSAQAVLAGSKHDPGMQVTAAAEDMKAALTSLIRAGMSPTNFTTGKTGYATSGQLQARGQSYQAQAHAVLIAGR